MKRKKIIKKLEELGFEVQPVTGALIFNDKFVAKTCNMTNLTVKDIEQAIKEQSK